MMKIEDGAGWDDKVDDLVTQAHKAVYKDGDAKRALWLLEQAVAILEDELERQTDDR